MTDASGVVRDTVQPLALTVKGGGVGWTLASDIGQRLHELCDGLEVNLTQFARRAGVRPAQVRNWLNGTQKPAKSRLEVWAQREGWPVEMFAEGGPRPAAILVNLPANGTASGSPTRSGRGRRVGDREAAALASRLAFLRDQVRAYAALGKAPGPEILAEWLRVTADYEENTNRPRPDAPPAPAPETE